MIIDGHAHAFGDYLTAQSIAETLEAAGAHQVVLSPGESAGNGGYWLPDLASRWPGWDPMRAVNRIVRVAVALSGKSSDIPAGNEEVFRLRQAIPGLVRQCYWLDPRPTGAMEDLARHFDQWRFCMVKLHQCWTPFTPSDQVIESVAAWCGETGLPLFVHIYRRNDVLSFLNLCRRHRRTQFILGHLIGAASAEENLRKLDNVYIDTSPPQLVASARILEAVRRVGSGRLLLGSDTPYGRQNLRRAIERVDSLPLTSVDKEMILGGNLAAMLSAVDPRAGGTSYGSDEQARTWRT